jgi:hypothetical protein
VDKWKKVFINPDLDAEERRKSKALREELRAPRERGERDVTIQKGKIVRRRVVLEEFLNEETKVKLGLEADNK